jgi:hypothetical protein
VGVGTFWYGDMTDLNISVAASSDDGEEASAPAEPGLISTDLDFYAGTDNYVGLRFLNVTIPAGSTIDSVVVRFVAVNNRTDVHHQTIYCEDIDDAPTFTTDSGNISSRTRTSASQAWDPGDLTANASYDTADFSAVLQEVIDRGGWASGQDVVVLILGSTTQTVQGEAYSWDSSSNFPQLRITYTTGHAGTLVNSTRLKSKVFGGLA